MISCCEASPQPSWLCIYHDILTSFYTSCLCLVLFSSIVYNIWIHVFVHVRLWIIIITKCKPCFLCVWLCQACIQFIGGKHFLLKMVPHYSRRSGVPWCNHCIIYNGQISKCDYSNIEILLAITGTGSRGDVFVVRTSKPVENLWKNGLFWSRYSFVTHSIDRKPRDWGLARSALCSSVTLRATCRAPARIRLAVIDFQKSIWVR